MKPLLLILALVLTVATVVFFLTTTGVVPDAAASSASAERGGYLVKAFGCADCHTPFKMGPTGPEPDLAMAFAGHPAGMQLPPPPQPVGPWMVSATATNTAWAGPWGISYTANLTPDAETGLGRWTADQFMMAIRTGRHLGRGRPILPPMPTPALNNLTDDDLRAVFAYLKTLPPIVNAVPDARPPAGAGTR